MKVTRYVPVLYVEALRRLDLPLPPMLHLVSSMVVDSRSGHDHVRLWSRGALVGELTLHLGDGAELARLLGLVLDPAAEVEAVQRLELETVIGAGLDVLGRSAGVLRHGRDDDSYRREILARRELVADCGCRIIASRGTTIIIHHDAACALSERENAADPKVGGDV